MKSIAGFTKIEFIEKKSRFIGLGYHINNVDEINMILDNLRQEYPNATHYTYAYILDDNQQKYSDDGEPNRTAGFPILEVIKNNNLNDCLLVIIRYFGGILLGAGGLIRAYSHTAALVINEACFTKKITTYYCQVTCDYNSIGGIDKIIREETELIKIDYGNVVDFFFNLSENKFDEVKTKIYNHNSYQDKLIILEEKQEYVKEDC
ncbi:MAG: YigZ family protein [Candidatus Izemoplasmatales bacterium]